MPGDGFSSLGARMGAIKLIMAGISSIVGLLILYG